MHAVRKAFPIPISRTRLPYVEIEYASIIVVGPTHIPIRLSRRLSFPVQALALFLSISLSCSIEGCCPDRAPPSHVITPLPSPFLRHQPVINQNTAGIRSDLSPVVVIFLCSLCCLCWWKMGALGLCSRCRWRSVGFMCKIWAISLVFCAAIRFWLIFLSCLYLAKFSSSLFCAAATASLRLLSNQ